LYQLDEAVHVAITDEYKQYAGIDYRGKLIRQLADVKLSNSEIFHNFFSGPRPLCVIELYFVEFYTANLLATLEYYYFSV
jgi:hypothetical protein